MVAPAVMVSAAPAPATMMAPAAAARAMAVPVAMSPDLNHRIILRGKRRDPDSGRSGCGHCQQQCAANQYDASHAVVLPSHDCDIGYNFPLPCWFRLREKYRYLLERKRRHCRLFPNIAGYQLIGSELWNPLAS